MYFVIGNCEGLDLLYPGVKWRGATYPCAGLLSMLVKSRILYYSSIFEVFYANASLRSLLAIPLGLAGFRFTNLVSCLD